MADASLHQTKTTNEPNDLFWLPFFTQESAYQQEIRLTIMRVAP